MRRAAGSPKPKTAAEATAMWTDELEEWPRTKTNRSPLARSLSALEGFVAAVVAGPVSMDPPTWICLALGVERDAFNHGGTAKFGVICATAVLHNRISDTLTKEPEHVRSTANLTPPAPQETKRRSRPPKNGGDMHQRI